MITIKHVGAASGLVKKIFFAMMDYPRHVLKFVALPQGWDPVEKCDRERYTVGPMGKPSFILMNMEMMRKFDEDIHGVEGYAYKEYYREVENGHNLWMFDGVKIIVSEQVGILDIHIV